MSIILKRCISFLEFSRVQRYAGVVAAEYLPAVVLAKVGIQQIAHPILVTWEEN